jgi:LysM repeat protein
MSDKDSAQNVIDSYRKRRQNTGPFLIGGLAIILLAVGVIVVIMWLRGGQVPSISFFATETPTATVTNTSTATATVTPTETNTSTPTDTPTITLTPTASGPFIYIVEENDNLFSIAEKFDVDVLVLMALNNLTYDSVIRVGDELLIPPPNLELPTDTPLPDDTRGTIEYVVKTADTLEGIAVKFNSTVEAIIEENEGLENANEIFVGQVLIIPVNIATPQPTSTPGPAATLTPPTSEPTVTSTP